MKIAEKLTAPGGIPASQVSAVIMRGFLVAFLPWVFSILHRGARPLKMDWYLWAVCQAFQKTAVGRSRRLVVNVPPRHLKSITATAYTAWMLGRSPALKIMIATYGDKLGRDHLERLQVIMAHPLYRRLFPGARLRPGGPGRGYLSTTKGGGCRVVTVNGATTGFGADIIIIDDAMKAEDITSEARRAELDRFYRQTLLTRLNDKRRGIIISIQQRLGEDDLPARLLEAGADHLCLPSYDDRERVYDLGMGRQYRRPVGEVLRPDDEPMDVLEAFRREMGPRDFATQYLQQPGAADGNIIQLAKIPRFKLGEVPRSRFEMVVQSLDTAVSEEAGSAYTVLLTFARYNQRWHLIDVTRERLSYPRLRDMTRAQMTLWQPDHILIEDQSSGSQLYQDLRYCYGIRPIMIKPLADKLTRMIGQLGLIEDGFLAIPEEAPWLDDFMNELRLFPASKYMDQVDSLAQFLDWAKRRGRSHSVPRHPESGRKLYVARKAQVHRR